MNNTEILELTNKIYDDIILFDDMEKSISILFNLGRRGYGSKSIDGTICELNSKLKNIKETYECDFKLLESIRNKQLKNPNIYKIVTKYSSFDPSKNKSHILYAYTKKEAIILAKLNIRDDLLEYWDVDNIETLSIIGTSTTQRNIGIIATT